MRKPRRPRRSNLRDEATRAKGTRLQWEVHEMENLAKIPQKVVSEEVSLGETLTLLLWGDFPQVLLSVVPEAQFV